MTRVKINNITIEAREGESILSVLNAHGIKVPTLCYMKDFSPSGACRMCVVEVEGNKNLVTACSEPIRDGMVIKTHSPKVIKARRTNVELLLANHPDDCLYCIRNGNCELQQLAIELNIRERKFSRPLILPRMDMSSAGIIKEASKCIVCGRCVRICEEKQHVSALEFINKGSETHIGTTYNKDLNFSSCIQCGQCILSCPTGALYEKENINEYIEAVHDPKRIVIVQVSPLISVTFAEKFGLKPGRDYTSHLYSAIMQSGADYIIESALGADIAYTEEAYTLADRVGKQEKLPLISSHCPAVVKYIEQFNHELIPFLSSCKSPQQITGSLIKNYYAEKFSVSPENVISVSIVPCTANKYESQREEMTTRGVPDIDIVLTTRELSRLINISGIDMNNSPQYVNPEKIVSRVSSSGKLYGCSGGIAESVARVFYQRLSDTDINLPKISNLRLFKDFKETKIQHKNKEYSFAAIHNLSYLKELEKQIASGTCPHTYIEIMACPGGCTGGGGQYYETTEDDCKNRAKLIYGFDEQETMKYPYKNPEVKEIYKDFLEAPGSMKSKKITHTRFSKKDVLT